MLRSREIRRLVEEHGHAGYLAIQAQLLGLNANGGVPEGPDGKPLLESHVTLGNGNKVLRKRPEAFGIKALWEGLVGDVSETLSFAMQNAGYMENPILESEGSGAVSSSAFASAVGQLIATKVIEGYDSPGFIGDQLVTEMSSTHRGERVVGFTDLQGPKVVEEGGEYQESTFAEKYVGTVETKRGRLLSITEEAVFFDQTGEILRRASNLGRKSREDRERRIVRGVADVSSTERIYRPSGTATQLYSSGNKNLLATATPLVDWTDLQEALSYHAKTQRGDQEPDDENSTQPIVWMPTGLVTSSELSGVAARIFAATIVASGGVEAPAGAILNAMNQGQIRPLWSVFLDAAQGEDQWDDASDWLIGDYPRAFIYKAIWPLQTFRAPAQNMGQWLTDTVAAFKVREYGDVNCVDHRLVLKVNAV